MIMRNQKLTRACKRKPEKCKCDERTWEGWRTVCDHFKLDSSYGDGRCEHCEHEKECHQTPSPKEGAVWGPYKLHSDGWFRLEPKTDED
jgi:hypothetical protein